MAHKKSVHRQLFHDIHTARSVKCESIYGDSSYVNLLISSNVLKKNIQESTNLKTEWRDREREQIIIDLIL